MENITIRNTKTGAVRHNMNAYAWSLNTNKGDWVEVSKPSPANTTVKKSGFIPEEIKALKTPDDLDKFTGEVKAKIETEPLGNGKAIVNVSVADDVTTQKTTPAKVVQANIASKPIEKKNYPTATKK